MPFVLGNLRLKEFINNLKLYQGKGKTYAILYHLTAMVHLFYAILFSIEKCKILTDINIALVIFYIVIGSVSLKAISFKGVFTSCTVAMTLFLMSHYILLGPSFGFQYLSIGMIPFMYYLTYINETDSSIATKGAIASYIGLIIVMGICSYIKYPILNVSEVSQRIISILNISITFLVSIRFMSEFVKKAYNDTGVLETKNVDLELSANIDALTGLFNRRNVENYINRVLFMARGQGKDFSMLMCDLDDFKKINDTYGHDCGDQVLKNVSSIIKSELRPEDVVFRWGGEEILIIVNAKGHIAKDVAERCRKAIENYSFNYEGNDIKVTITIGGASYYQGATRDDLIHRADNNLYEGKKNGKNQVVM